MNTALGEHSIPEGHAGSCQGCGGAGGEENRACESRVRAGATLQETVSVAASILPRASVPWAGGSELGDGGSVPWARGSMQGAQSSGPTENAGPCNFHQATEDNNYETHLRSLSFRHVVKSHVML